MTKNTSQNFLVKFLADNALQLALMLAGIVAAWTMFSARISAIEVKAQETSEKVSQLQSLVERVIVLEEDRKNTDSTIQEIKGDIKDLKAHFNVR